jgi:D-alanyl-D-alanine carboxypeptidase/D-alanyl-D-alanine-endopeptidase (penicillin-binding protein 4)
VRKPRILAILVRVMRRFFIGCALAFLLPRIAASDTTLDLAQLVRNGSVRVEKDDGTPVLRYRDSEHFIPASILKIATAYCALEELGENYRYETVFLSDGRSTLFIKGSGDPTLVSENLEAIAAKLSQKLSRIEEIVIDTSLYSDDLIIDGVSRSTNPYDAKNAAFVGNFSSAYLHHSKKGEVRSAEPQTPLTPLARQAALRLPRGTTERVNLSSDWTVGVRYGGELLAAFLRKHGVQGMMSIKRSEVPSTASPLMAHASPEPLAEIARAMLKYSTNFTANQIFLTLGVKRFGAPATVEKGQRAMRECLERKIGWRNFHVEEGSGLSRKNQVTTYDMTRLLKHFNAYSALLPEKQGFYAKTGSLRGVNSLAGYFLLDPTERPVRFSIIINSDVPHLYKFKVAEQIRSALQTNGATESN